MKTSLLLRIFVGGALGTFAAFLAILVPVLTIYPGLRDIFPEAISDFAIWMGIPALVAGVIVGWRSISSAPFLIGLFGIALGVFWHLHLGNLSAELANAYADVQPGQRLAGYSMEDGFFLQRWFTNAEYAFLLSGKVIPNCVMVMLPILCGILGRWIAITFLKPAGETAA